MPVKKIFIFFIRTYQLIVNPHIRSCCRFNPTCSEYAIGTFKKYSSIKAFFLTIKRIFKCHPFHKGGDDPV
ncbi:MAG TPA: membrane protein insertion efficiency factor YidD [Chlamydiae bacterium]|nr:membrane protein insertion efficiency factor YidD [Chlamydiota bacterium]